MRFLLTVLALLFSLTCVSAQPTSAPDTPSWVTVPSSTKSYPAIKGNNAAPVKGNTAAVAEDQFRVFPIIQYEWVECRVKWDQNCEGAYKFTAPPDYIVCQPLYKVTEANGNHGYAATPGDFYPNDIENPPRFRSVTISMQAKGSGNLFNRWGSVIKLSDVGISVVRFEVANDKRFALGCLMASP